MMFMLRLCYVIWCDSYLDNEANNSGFSHEFLDLVTGHIVYIWNILSLLFALLCSVLLCLL